MAVLDIDSAINSYSNGTSATIYMQPISVAISVNTYNSGDVVRMYPGISSAVSSSAQVIVDAVRLKYFASSVTSIASILITEIKKYRTLATDIMVNSSMDVYRTDRDILASLRGYLPSILRDSKIFEELQKTQGIEATRLFAFVDKLLLDYFIDSTSVEGITLWENDFGIQPVGKTLEQRRQLVKARLHKPEILTKQRLEQVLTENFYSCSVEKRPSERHVITTIIGKRGIPNDINEMIDLVDVLLPAHLTHEFIYTYLPWGEIESAALTWGQAEQYRWGEFETAFLV